MTFKHLSTLALVLLFLGCSPSTPKAVPTSAPPAASSTPIAALPTEEPANEPVPLAAARIVESFGAQVLASQNGNYQAQLKPVGPNLDIALLKTASVNEPGFSTGAASGPRDFEGRIIGDIQEHPEFRLPLVVVLEAAQKPENVEALHLTEQHLSTAGALLKTVQALPE